MDQEYVAKSIEKFYKKENINPLTSPIDLYNKWAQTEKVIIEDPELANWALERIKGLLNTDSDVIDNFIS